MENTYQLTINGKTYFVEIEKTSEQYYITAINELRIEIVTEKDSKKWKDFRKVSYNGKTFIPFNISATFKFEIAKNGKSINWTYKDATFGGSDEKEGVKKAIENLVKEIEFK